MKRLLVAAGLSAALMGGMTALPALAETEIVMPGWADYSGPYADIMPGWEGGRVAVIEWWNANKGKELGVKLTYKGVDGRYDPAQVASLWPGVLSEFKPVLLFGMGGADYAAMKTRLPEDKVPMISPTGGYGFTWADNPWSFNLRPTLAHEAAMYVEWRRKSEAMTRPLKVVVVASEAAPAWVDTVNGIKAFAAGNPDKLDLVDVIWTAPQPTDLTTDIFAAVSKQIDAVIVMTNSAGSVAVKTALDNVGSDVPLMLGAHNGLTAAGAAIGGMETLTNTFECAAMAPPVSGTEAAAFYDELHVSYGLEPAWDNATILGISQGLFIVAIMEETIRRYGAGEFDGEKVREVILDYTVPAAAMHGFTGDMKMNNESSFPLSGLIGYCATVNAGAFMVLEGAVPVPEIPKW
ncbi:ABC transporter substrate-binding protein [Roseovarius amoyensis]|uniref:ABC transporter substrate-binding protein n=1 Tax=Roseovarius amoyensis TaxID=2211448 RepID=UPI0013A6C932|nr:ABC transporter substrate-binding protein [Roseovarius amoyensis]